MKRFFIALLCLTAIGFYSFRTVSNKYADVLTSLGIPPAMAKDLVSNSFIGGFFSQPRNPAYKTYPAGKRAEAVQQIGAFTKNYLNSAEFQKRYAENYELMKPRTPKTVDERVQETLANFKSQLKDNEASYKKVDAAYKSIIMDNIKGFKKLIASYEDKNDPQYNKNMQIVKMGYDGEMKYYQEQIAALDKKFPKDVKQFIKGRLEEFLQLTADIDFNAELVQNGKKKKFVNPTYEGKSLSWKYCFRAGKETIDAARMFAQQWLKEL
jgi:hypothetical protein